MAKGSRRAQKMKKAGIGDMRRMTKIILIIIGIVVLIGAVLTVSAMIAIHQGAKGHEVEGDTPAVVLGCHVKDGRPSRILGERIDAAYESAPLT